MCLIVVAKSQSLFNDPAEKIQELVVLIKQDIQFLDKKINDLEKLVRQQKHANEQMGTHTETIVEALKSNLVTTTNNFRKVLEIRTQVSQKNSATANTNFSFFCIWNENNRMWCVCVFVWM
jgi:hypothetical protein